MSFATDLASYTAADLIFAFPGIPRSTAYDWLAGTREPVSYLQPLALAHLRRSVRKDGPAGQDAGDKRRKRPIRKRS
jgi:hypothetical protein